MFEKPPSFEKKTERIPEEAEISFLFEKLTNGIEWEEVRKCSDEKGLYLWDIKGIASDGSIVEWSYMRAGQYPEGKALRSAIHVTFCDEEGMPVGGHSVAVLDHGEWNIQE